MGSKVAYSFSTLPPAAVMAASALFENACALTASAFEIVPLPRIFTLSFDEMKPAAMSVSTVTSVSDFLAASSSSVERLMALN